MDYAGRAEDVGSSPDLSKKGVSYFNAFFNV
jgi:hypothetical protein